MNEYNLLNICFLFVTLFSFSLILMKWEKISFFPALITVSIKYFIPFFYFLFFEQIFIFDDIKYFQIAENLIKTNSNPMQFFFENNNLTYIEYLNTGQHWFYSWWNFLLMYYFGSYYFVPVFFNVLISFFSACLLIRIVKKVISVSPHYLSGLFIFFLLHWAVLSWTSFLNLKDTIVIFFTLIFVLGAVSFKKISEWKYLIAMLVSLYILTHTRFYIVALLLLSYATSLILVKITRERYLMFLFISLLLIYLFLPAELIYKKYYFSKNYYYYNNMHGFQEIKIILFNMIRVLLTPFPWVVLDTLYSFLYIATFLNFFMFIPFVIGCYLLANKIKGIGIFIIIYSLFLILFYSLNDVILGARQSYQLCWMICWAQYHAVYTYLAARNLHYFKL